MKPAIVLGVLALPLAAGADEIFLRSGGRLSGVVVERRADGIVVDVGPGRVTLPATLIAKVVDGTPAFALFRERASRLADVDVNGWVALGTWARDHELLTQSREAFEHVLAIDPANPAAHRELGHVNVEGRWMTPEEGYRARGYVNFEGSWVTPEDRSAMLVERAAAAQARQAEIEAEARIREAEARARTAEAEARRAEAAAAPGEGIPVGMAYGSVPYGVYGPVVVGGYTYGGGGIGEGHRAGHRGRSNGQGPGNGSGPSCGPGRTVPPPAPARTPSHDVGGSRSTARTSGSH
jgi:hypothetical protein